MSKPKQMAMVIDLLKCVGCGACAIACKTQNNTQMSLRDGSTFNWADYIIKMEGKYPNPKYMVIPVLCNHCDDPNCIKACPEPKALYKTEEGIVMYNRRYCLGEKCRKCMIDEKNKCPYSAEFPLKAGFQYSVISFNRVGMRPHGEWAEKSEYLPGITSSPEEVSKKVGVYPPYRHEYTFRDAKPVGDFHKQPGMRTMGRGETAVIREPEWIEKCHFCIHRVRRGEQPYCVVSCPTGARVFGDKNDPNSEVAKLLAKYKPLRLKNNKGEWLREDEIEKSTKPNVYYIRSYSVKG